MSSPGDEKEADVSNSESIWESVDSSELQEHPLLQTAFHLFRQNLEGCISRSYRDVDTESATNHNKVLLNLPGKFGLADLPPKIYGRTRGNVGILFNRNLVRSSTAYVKEVGMEIDAINRVHDDFHVLTYIAVLQETLEHELGQWKFHCEGASSMAQDGKADIAIDVLTPEKLRHEAGYMVQQRIREDHFNERVQTADLKIIRLGGPEDDNEHFRVPLKPTFECMEEFPTGRDDQFALKGDESDDDADADQPGIYDPLTKNDILKHMEYASHSSPCNNKRKREDDTDFSGNPPDDAGPSNRDGGGEGGGKPPPPPPPPSSRYGGSWQGSIQSFLPTAVRTATRIANQKMKTQSETSLTGWDSLRQRPRKKTSYTREAPTHCHFQIAICDEDRNEKSKFFKDEHIYFLLKVTNPTLTTISIGVPWGACLGCDRLVVRIDGQEPGRKEYSKLGWLELPPEKSYTLFKMLTKPKNDESVEYGTPPTGKYVARVWVANQEPVVQSTASFEVM